MERNQLILKYSLIAGAVYFACISLAHLTGMKVPGLYIYYNIESHQYQDRIISFLAFGWASFFYSSATNRRSVPYLLFSCIVALFMLISINTSQNLELLGEGISFRPFWVQTALLCFYVSWLIVYFYKTKTLYINKGVNA